MLFVNKIFESAPLVNMVQDDPETGGKKLQPSFRIKGKITKSIIKDLIKTSLLSSGHPIGTCSMLPRDEGGVVDPMLRVNGTKNLRVIDASDFPLQIQGNIASVVYAAAEKAADIMK